MWAKNLLPSSFSRFVRRPGKASEAERAPRCERQRSVPPQRQDAGLSVPTAHVGGSGFPQIEGARVEEVRSPRPVCPRAFKMISFRQPCGCGACDPNARNRQEVLPTFGRPEKSLPTFGRSASTPSLHRAASSRSLSPRRAERPEREACDWGSLFVLTGELGIRQVQVLRKLRDEQEEQLLDSTASASPSSSCSYQAKILPKDEPKETGKAERASVRKLKPKSKPDKPDAKPGAKLDAKLDAKPDTKADATDAKSDAKPDVTRTLRTPRARSATPATRAAPATPRQASKAKAKPKPKAKAKVQAEVKDDSPTLKSLPTSLPMTLTYGCMFSEEGEEVLLENCCGVSEILEDLHSSIAAELCKHFHIRYDFLLEQHCQERKAGVARRTPKHVNGEDRYLTTVRLRVRKHPAKGNPQQDFISKGAQLAILLHELAHLRYMNHGQEFMLFLREIYAEARRRNLFDPGLVNELPSCRPWENLIYQTGGDVDAESLLNLFEPDASTCATPRNASPAPRPREQVGAETRMPPTKCGEQRPSAASKASASTDATDATDGAER
ncbi:unnamed protein product [Effrenium voratum]|nr:unnamed protein product [Effrenium voratum]